MKPPAGKPRASRRPAEKRLVQLNLRRTPTWPEEDELNERPDGNFWKWFGIVFCCHIVAFIVLLIAFNHKTKPPQQFIEVMPPGEIAKGNPGPQTAPKLGTTMPAPSREVTLPTPVTPPTPKPKVQKAQPPAPKPPAILTDNAPTAIAPPVKPKPKPIAKPKVKVDLTLTDAPQDDTPAPTPPPPKATKPKKPAHKSQADISADTAADSQGLSKQEVAAKLGDQFQDSGFQKADHAGVSGSAKGKATDFGAYKQLIHDCVMNKWNVPNLSDPTATEPLVNIHIDKNGYVPPSSVSLAHSSGNPAIDQSALEAARALGQLPQPLPDGFPSDTSINFQLQN